MARLWPLLLVLAALGAIAFLFLGGEDGGLLGDAADHAEDDEYVPPELRGHRGGEDWRNPTDRPPAPGRTERPAETTSEDDEVLFLEGRVLDAETEAPLRDVRLWLLRHQEPCPRLADHPDPFGAGSMLVETDKEGRFRFRAPPGEAPGGKLDLFAHRSGYILGLACAPAIPGEITLRLEKGLQLDGYVRTPDGRTVEDATLRARPGPETPAEPGHGSVIPFHERTDEQGRFTLDGLLPGALLVDVEHFAYMPQTVGPVDPADGDELEITLVPALRATFQVRTDDGRDPEHATLVWRTTGANPRSEVLLLAPASNFAQPEPPAGGTPTGELTSAPVRLPCDAPSIVLELKADGYATWTSEPLRLPSEGGEETYEITLTGDLATGSAKISLEDEAGEKVHFAEAAIEVAVMRMTPGTRSSAYVLEQREDLRITDLPAGLYRVLLRSARFAPLQTDLTIEVGQQAESVLRVRPPAKLKVSFAADDQTLVRFRLTQGNETVYGVPEGSFSRGEDEETGEPVLSAGQDGLLLSGLAAGTYTIEVLSEEHTAPPTIVHLVEGDTVETEIRVRLR